jgi:hypothetical protein
MGFFEVNMDIDDAFDLGTNAVYAEGQCDLDEIIEREGSLVDRVTARSDQVTMKAIQRRNRRRANRA